ncbi:hypothetical protein CAEBREN_00233 [Caenorhabditis brenneri]|uniref:Uncharacterized protein n=1 Tax=Caenorhabditis brenneri TaxID=135651 RepID=G0M6X4_CAEBE|nr:hypothetical protein CAEBREN_00233 [Caenorhabditis brenneri]
MGLSWFKKYDAHPPSTRSSRHDPKMQNYEDPLKHLRTFPKHPKIIKPQRRNSPLPVKRSRSKREKEAAPAKSRNGAVPRSVKREPVGEEEENEEVENPKAFDRPKTAHRNSRPPTSTYTLPSFGNGRLPTASKHLKLTMNRSNSETRALPIIAYGRSPSREKMTDLRDELFQAKKKVAGYEIDMKKLSTEMKRLKRDAEKRETFLERIVTAQVIETQNILIEKSTFQYHPTELNDTNLARTLTAIKSKEVAKEKMIDIQAKELERLRSLLKDHHFPVEQKHPIQSMTIPDAPGPEPNSSNEDEEDEESDYPEEPNQLENEDFSELDDNFDEVFEEAVVKKVEKNGKAKSKPKAEGKDRNSLAKKYAEQNAKLKEKLKEVRSNYASMLEKNKKKGEEFVKQSENSKAVVDRTVEISSVLDTLQKEREELSEAKKKNQEKIEDLNQELTEAYGEIDALKMDNERLQENLREYENRMGNLNNNPAFEARPPLNIPRLDMTDIDVDECTLHDITERSNSSDFSEFHLEQLAGALAELAGAHCERLNILTQTQ